MALPVSSKSQSTSPCTETAPASSALEAHSANEIIYDTLSTLTSPTATVPPTSSESSAVPDLPELCPPSKSDD